MHLAVDLGNTTAKIGLFDDNQLLTTYAPVSLDDVIRLVQETPVSHAVVCSVNQDATGWQQALQPFITSVWVLNHQLPVPLRLRYQTPQTLGADRVAAVCGAKVLYPAKTCLVMDVGTCLTYDLVDIDNLHWGGSISPGLRMRFRAIHAFTARLPLLEPEPAPELIGVTTKDAILSGVINGMTAEMEGIIRKYGENFPEMRVLFCGGDAKFFENSVKEPIFVIPELVLIGLNRIIQHNVFLS